MITCLLCGEIATGYHAGECVPPITRSYESWECTEEYDDYRCNACREQDEEWTPLTTFDHIHAAAIAAGQTEYDPDGDDITFDYYELTERAEYCRPVAWICQTDMSAVVYACTALEAFWSAEADWGLSEVSVDRAPEWDNREFTPRAAIEDGWVWRCGNCGHQIDWEGCSRHDNVEPVYTPDNAYCCKECAP
jgi:hypothetical protein